MNRLHPSDPRAPKYWQHETSGVLCEPIRKYLAGESLTPGDIAKLRAYFKQWIDSPAWDLNPHMGSDERHDLQDLRESAKAICTRADIDKWLQRAISHGVDPL